MKLPPGHIKPDEPCQEAVKTERPGRGTRARCKEQSTCNLRDRQKNGSQDLD